MSISSFSIPELPGAEPRLRRRYHRLVVSHLPPADRVAAGPRVPPGLGTSFAATQAAWRFYANPGVSLPQLAKPLLDCAAGAVAGSCDAHVLVALDWSPLHYNGHGSKGDRVALSNRNDLGYELLTALALGDRDGSPLAPLCLELRAADGVHSTRGERVLPARSPLDALGPVMRHAAALPALAGTPGTLESAKPPVLPVFLVDRQGDSVGHYRRWDKAGRLFVVRADDAPRAVHEGAHRPLGEVADRLKREGALADAGPVLFRGVPARQFVAEAEVVLRRPARTQRVDKKTGKPRHRNVRGRPVALRLVVSEVRDPDTGGVLARWLLLTNLPASGPGAVPAARVALWYYWRWRIESYHKLLKGAGQHAECWQQETAAALARRLAVAAMAAVVVWRLARDDSPAAGELRGVLVRLSGRQMKRGKGGKGPDGTPARGFTEPALMAGLGVLLPMLELLNTHDPDDLRRLAEAALPGIVRRDGG